MTGPQAAEVPPDAKALVAAILEEAIEARLPSSFGNRAFVGLDTIQAHATRLAVLLDERDAAAERLVAVLIARPGGYQEWGEAKLRDDVKNGSDRYLAQWELDVRAALKEAHNG